MFQSTLPRGERRPLVLLTYAFKKFQSTLPRGERRLWARTQNCVLRFNPRSHAGSDIRLAAHDRQHRRFNPRSHAGSDSICTGRQGITFSFNPRSHAGSDVRRAAAPARMVPFQSTLPRGERRAPLWQVHMLCDVSIHAPTRGATWGCRMARRRSSCFNPRSHAGSDERFRRAAC